MNYYCDSCKKVFKTIANSRKGLECCPDCLGELIFAPRHFVPKQDIDTSSIKSKFRNKFTDKERKSIFREYKKHIKSIPTWYERYPELAEEAYGKSWKSVLHDIGCEVKGW